MRTKTCVACVIVGLIATTSGTGAVRSGQAPSRNDAARRFVGTWKLVSFSRSGQPLPNVGAKPTGLIYYDRTGYMAAQVMPDRARPGWTNREPTPDEARVAILGYTAYFGTYSVDESKGTVTHHRLGRLNPGGPDDLVRRYQFVTEDRLILTPADSPTDQIAWERVK